MPFIVQNGVLPLVYVPSLIFYFLFFILRFYPWNLGVFSALVYIHKWFTCVIVRHQHIYLCSFTHGHMKMVCRSGHFHMYMIHMHNGQASWCLFALSYTWVNNMWELWTNKSIFTPKCETLYISHWQKGTSTCFTWWMHLVMQLVIASNPINSFSIFFITMRPIFVIQTPRPLSWLS